VDDISKIIVASRLNDELKSHLRLEGEVIYLDEHEVEDYDYSKVDAFIGFSLPKAASVENLKWIHGLGAGVDGILRNKSIQTNTVVTRTIGRFGRKIAEYILGRMLFLTQRIETYETAQEECRWIRDVQPIALFERKVLIYGTGSIGSSVAEVLSKMGVRVYGIARREKSKEFFIEISDKDEEMLKSQKFDWIINTLPLTDLTENYFDEKRFSLMQGGNFINVGRGQSVQTKALLEALRLGNVGHAFLDVTEEEPLPDTSLLWSNRRIHITPHIAAYTDVGEAAKAINETFDKLKKGQPLPNRISVTNQY